MNDELYERSPTKTRCRLQEAFVPLRNAAAVRRRFSYPYEMLLPSAGGFRTPTKRRCRPQEVFVPLRNVAAICRRFS